MAQENIGIGTAANDGTGDPLRTGGDKINQNFTELYNELGWAFYVQNQLTPSTQVITTTPSKLIIDGGGATSTSDYLPLSIRGSGELWDTVNNKITPIALGDGYTLRLDLNVTAESANPNSLKLILDIGGGATATNIILSRIITTGKALPYTVSVGFPFFSLATFVANGGQFFLETDTGTVTLTIRQISIHRISANLG